MLKKTSNLEASKLSQDILLGGKRKRDSQVNPSKQDISKNGKKNKNGGNGGQNVGNNNNRGRLQPAQIPRFREYTPLMDMVATFFRKA